jgi:hypothetical protein
MHIRVIDNFVIGQYAHHTLRTRKFTLVNIYLNNKIYLALELSGTQNPQSGKNVVVAFRDKEENSIFGWITPNTNKFILVDDWNPLLILALSVFVWIIVIKLMDSALISYWQGILLMFLGVAGLVYTVVKIFAYRKNLELSMRDALMQNSLSKD